MDSLSLDKLGKKFLSPKGEIDEKTVKESPLIGLYFSAHWCPTCKNFTPLLADFYKNVNKEKKEVEIIFSSMDNDDAQFKEYYSSMPWLAFPFTSSVNEELVEQFNIQGIPALVVIDKNGKVIDKAGRVTVQNKNLCSLDIWKGNK